MNILIVTSYRCGSLSLAKWLKRELSEQDPQLDVGVPYTIIANPFSDENKSVRDNFYDIKNSIVILLFEDYKKMLNENDFLAEEKFDFTICLKRISSNLQAESYLSNKNRPYFLSNEWIDSNKKEIKKLTSKFKKEYDEMSNVFGYHANYESIFDENETPEDLWNIASYIGIRPAFYWTIKPNFKFRRFSKVNLI
jgi:hypothetical protein